MTVLLGGRKASMTARITERIASVASARGASAPPHDVGGEGLQRVPVVGALAEGDVEPRAAEHPELVHHLPRGPHRTPEIPEPAQFAERAGHVADVDSEFHVAPR